MKTQISSPAQTRNAKKTQPHSNRNKPEPSSARSNKPAKKTKAFSNKNNPKSSSARAGQLAKKAKAQMAQKTKALSNNKAKSSSARTGQPAKKAKAQMAQKTHASIDNNNPNPSSARAGQTAKKAKVQTTQKTQASGQKNNPMPPSTVANDGAKNAQSTPPTAGNGGEAGLLSLEQVFSALGQFGVPNQMNAELKQMAEQLIQNGADPEQLSETLQGRLQQAASEGVRDPKEMASVAAKVLGDAESTILLNTTVHHLSQMGASPELNQNLQALIAQMLKMGVPPDQINKIIQSTLEQGNNPSPNGAQPQSGEPQPASGMDQAQGPMVQPQAGMEQAQGPMAQPQAGMEQAQGPMAQPQAGMEQAQGPMAQPQAGMEQAQGPMAQPQTAADPSQMGMEQSTDSGLSEVSQAAQQVGQMALDTLQRLVNEQLQSIKSTLGNLDASKATAQTPESANPSAGATESMTQTANQGTASNPDQLIGTVVQALQSFMMNNANTETAQ